MYHDNVLGVQVPGKSRSACVLTDAETADTRVRIHPQNADDLALMLDMEVADLPDVLRNWRYDKPYTGNDILQRIDPVEAKIKDPWMKLPLSVTFYLSKRAMKMLNKRIETFRVIEE